MLTSGILSCSTDVDMRYFIFFNFYVLQMSTFNIVIIFIYECQYPVFNFVLWMSTFVMSFILPDV